MTTKKKPEKPYPAFPLFPHASGKWAKKIGGKLCYFGRWDDPDGALEEYERLQQRPPAKRVRTEALTLEQAANAFLTAKKRAVEKEQIAERTYDEYRGACRRFVKFFGHQHRVSAIQRPQFDSYHQHRLGPLNPVSAGNEVTRIRVWFRWLKEAKLIPEPADFGPDFRKPSQKTLRRLRRAKGKEQFTPGAIHTLLDEAGVHLRAMILLGINCGYGPGDCGKLIIPDVDLETGWIDYPRPKTEVDRLSPLWAETVDALCLSLQRRPEPHETAANRFFVRPNGKPWDNDLSALSKYFTAVRRRVLREGGFYWLRKTFATVAGGSKDQVAVNFLMGHVDPSMAAIYRQEVDPERLVAATDHVRAWLKPDC